MGSSRTEDSKLYIIRTYSGTRMLEAMFGININNTANILIQLSQVKEGKKEVMMGSYDGELKGQMLEPK